MLEKYRRGELPIPEGFQIYEERVHVAGLPLRKKAAGYFFRAQSQSLMLQADPGNALDRNAIKVIGLLKGWFSTKTIELGFVPQEIAARIVEAEVDDVVRARLLKSYAGQDDFHEVLFQLLGPEEQFPVYQALKKLARG